MMYIKISLLFFILISFALHLTAQLDNQLYEISIPSDFKKRPRFVVIHKSSRISREVVPQIQLVFSATSPGLVPANLDGYRGLVGWKGTGSRTESNIFKLNGQVMIASRVIQKDRQLIFTFPPSDYGVATLTVELPPGDESPSFIMGVTATQPGWYSLGFTGLQPEKPEALDFLYQPLTWSWKRFPSQAALTEEAYCTTAATFLNRSGFSEGIAPAPEMIPYRYALSTHWNNKESDQVGSGFGYTTRKGNSLFGLSIRNQDGLAQPMLFAPLLGGENSFLQADQRFRFTCKYLLAPGDWLAGSEFLLQNICKYKNERQNATVSLNQTLENMIEFGMNDRLSGWIDEYKAFDYRFDAPGTVKLVSALHALGVAMSTGDYDIYKRRALPMMEYVMSRQKFLFAIDTAQKMQSPAHLLRGPCAEIGELAGLYEMTGGHSSAFQKEADRLFGKPRQLNLQTVTGGASWQDYMAKYKLNSDPADLQQAVQGAQIYIEEYVKKYPTDFHSNPGLKDRQAAFQIDFTTNIYDLFELWEITGDRVFLDAARIGARHLLLWMRSNPLAPDSVITVNEGSMVEGIFPGRREGVVSHDFVPRDESTQIAEQKIPAWRTSLVGAIPEQHSTYVYGPILLAQHAAWFLRIAALTQDTLLADAAYNAVLGRYANFPGYYFNSLATNVYQMADYPMHDYYDIKYNAIFYNHVWPHIALLNDFLVSDAFYRSNGQVDFPSVYAPGYAFLTSKVYGQKPGKIFGHDNIQLWLPSGALQSNTTAVNHLFGIGKDALYLVLMNTSPKEETVEMQLNQDKITYDTDRRYRTEIYHHNGTTTPGEMVNGKLSVRLAAGDLAVVRILDLLIDIPFFHYGVGTPKTAVEQDFLRVTNEDLSLGTITGMLFNLTAEFSDAYVYSDVPETKVRKATLKYRIGTGNWQEVTDAVYPYEFSVHLDDPKQKLIFKWIAEAVNGEVSESGEMELGN